MAGKGKRILVVEDDPLVRQYVLRLLKSIGYEVLEAANGPAAVTILESDEPIDLLFTDLVMAGGMDGQQVAERARVVRPDLKVLFTSGYSERVVSRPGAAGGNIRLLSKPYRKADIVAALNDILDGSS